MKVQVSAPSFQLAFHSIEVGLPSRVLFRPCNRSVQ